MRAWGWLGLLGMLGLLGFSDRPGLFGLFGFFGLFALFGGPASKRLQQRIDPISQSPDMRDRNEGKPS
jgi:hypothetical protein